MKRFCGLLNFFLLLTAVPAHPMMGDADTTISTSSAEMSTVASKPSVEETDTTMTHAPTTTVAQLDSVTDVNTVASMDSSTTLSTITPSIAGMTNLFETPTAFVTDNKIQEPTTTAHSTSMPELSTMVEAVETSSVTLSDTTTHLTPASEQSTMMQTVDTTSHVTPASEMSTMVQALETNSVVSSDTTTHLTPASEQSTMVQAVDGNTVVPPETPSETITTTLPMTLPATTMTMTTSNQDANEILQPAGDPGFSASNLASLFGNNNMNPGGDLAVLNNIDGHADVDNVLTMSSNEETTRMASSTDSKIDGGDKQTAPSAPVTEPPKPQETNEMGDGNSGCHTISASLAVLSLAVFYLIV
ncbi:cell wall adhesin EAP1-like isoform X1 [Bradysia coprophila]|uniref:cell wall adhesin EAP1-like isoform X1 n=1 Tax=Bradysia coprophila TaxID=38358 RepID=UPI00187DCA39|nr:cell wall adhesin EAP1-like isoform X1 [Bradysia coprophila]